MKYTCTMLCLLLAASTGARGKGSSAKGKTSAQAAADHDFGCTPDAADLKPWEAKGLRVPSATKGHFKLWKSVSALEDFSASAKARCKTLPPKGAFVKGPGAGNTTRADVVVAQSDAKIYRVYSKAPFHCGFDPPALEYGSWWVLEARPRTRPATASSPRSATPGTTSRWWWPAR